jgi:hypothetical protein
VISWAGLPTVMVGGYLLLRLMNGKKPMSDFQRTYFRAGHAHAAVLLLMELLYHEYLERTDLSARAKTIASSAVVAGVLAQSGGFFAHMAFGKQGERSAGINLIEAGAATLVSADLYLAWAIATHPGTRTY